ncbi:MAG: hypothetical protein KDJ52_07120 [Anaerolineae bacterium]|nr:hypothetical protein [Anaerolineae bacterium]
MFCTQLFSSLTRLAVLVGVTLILIHIIALQPAYAQSQIFVPLIIKGHSNNAPPPTKIEGSFFVDTQLKTSSASIQVDAQGGMHLGYYYYEPANDGKPTYGVYWYCASNCENKSKWSGVGLGQLVNEIQLKLNANGQPRIIFRGPSQVRSTGNDYYYAECNQDCTNPARWQFIYLTTSSGLGLVDLEKDDKLPQRYFALDPNGRPRFVYGDGVTGHLGTYYAYCNSTCLNPNNWFETRINKISTQGPYRDENFYYPALTFSPQGQPRIVADGVSLQDEFFLYYLACDGACENENSWYSVPLADRGGGSEISYDIALDAAGKPRLVFYEGSLAGGGGDQLFYAWCNGTCSNGNSWQGVPLAINQNNGRGPDLELDANGRPRIAYALYDFGGLGYSWCNSNCESANGVWQHKVVESRADLLAEWPVAYPPHCDGGLWDGVAPTLALDKGGNPRIAYDTTYNARCTYIPETGEWEPTQVFHLIWRSVRVNFFPQP